MPGLGAGNRDGTGAGGQPEQRRTQGRSDGADQRDDSAGTRFGSSPDAYEDDAFVSNALLEAYNGIEFDDSGSPDN